MSVSTIGVNGTSIASNTNPLPVRLVPSATLPSYVDFQGSSDTLDAFQRLRVGEPRIAFEYTFSNGINSTYWDSAAYGAGTITPAVVAVGAVAPTLNNDFCQNLNTTTASGTGYWIQSLQHIRYAPGVSTLCRFTFNPTVAQANQTVRVGFFTDQGTFPSNAGDGIFFEMVGTGLFWDRRYLTGGGVGAVEQVAQASWNLDPCNGTGASGFNLNTSATIHIVIEFQWLGVGSVRVGFETANGIVWAHDFVSVNVLAVPYTRTGTLPARAEIFTTGVVAQAGLLKLINCVVLQEGDVMQYRGWRYHSAPATAGGLRTISATAAVGSWYPLLSIRPAVTNDATKRALVIPTKAMIQAVSLGTGPTGLCWGLYYGGNPTGATFATWGSENVQVDTVGAPATAITGGILVASGLLTFAANAITPIDFTYLFDNMIRISQNAAGSLTTSGACVMSLVVSPVGAAATAAPTFFASLDWKDLS